MSFSSSLYNLVPGLSPLCPRFVPGSLFAVVIGGPGFAPGVPGVLAKCRPVNGSSAGPGGCAGGSGGTLGHGIEMQADEAPEAAFRRYCEQEHRSKYRPFRITFVGPAQPERLDRAAIAASGRQE